MESNQERIEALKDRLRQAMTYRDMKAVELVERTGIPKGAISYYLSGKSQPKADRLYLIAQALNVSEAWLLGYKVAMERTPEQTKNDQLAKLIVRLRTDSKFFDSVSTLASLEENKYASVQQLLNAMRE